MGTRWIRVSEGLAAVGTTRYITIQTNAATQVILTSGYQGLSVFNLGSGSLIWGDSNISVNSGSYLFVNARVEWMDLQDAFGVYFRADSVSSLIAVTEYGV